MRQREGGHFTNLQKFRVWGGPNKLSGVGFSTLLLHLSLLLVGMLKQMISQFICLTFVLVVTVSLACCSGTYHKQGMSCHVISTCDYSRSKHVSLICSNGSSLKLTLKPLACLTHSIVLKPAVVYYASPWIFVRLIVFSVRGKICLKAICTCASIPLAVCHHLESLLMVVCCRLLQTAAIQALLAICSEAVPSFTTCSAAFCSHVLCCSVEGCACHQVSMYCKTCHCTTSSCTSCPSNIRYCAPHCGAYRSAYE